MFHRRRVALFAVTMAFLSFGWTANICAGGGREAAKPQEDRSSISVNDAIAALEARLQQQQAQIDQLTATLAAQQKLLNMRDQLAGDTDRFAPGSGAPLPKPGDPADASSVSQNEPLVTGEEIKQYTTKVDKLGKQLEATNAALGGFKFSGDFRFRFDGQWRSGNDIAGPLQNARSRYRLRMNTDKELDSMFKFHLTLSTGSFNNGITNDTDTAGTVAKPPFSISEAWVDFHPTKNFSLRGGRMEEVFADNMRFLWDDDIRFSGFQQIVTIPFDPGWAGFVSLEFRGGEYFLSNPNIAILTPTSPYVSAGFQVGKSVRDANLFNPGFILKQNLSKEWSQQFSGDFEFYRNPDQIQLASTAEGFPVVINPVLGLMLSGPMTGTGNATTTPGGATYTAPNFEIARAQYRISHKGITVHGREMPLFFDFQGARNTGTSRHRDAVIGTVNFGAVKNEGDVRILYQFALKQANSLISQFTDDDLGTGSGVNIKVNAIRVDVGITRFCQWQNLLFRQTELNANNPSEFFFVPLQAGSKSTIRWLSQLALTF